MNDVGLKFGERLGLEWASYLEVIVIWACEVGGFIKWCGLMALVTNTPTMVERRADVVVNRVSASEHRFTQGALIGHNTMVDVVALVVVGKLG